jgi:fatty acid synthase, animal type
LNFEADKLYPEITFPVSRGTPYLSHLMKWNHKQDWFVNFNMPGPGTSQVVKLNLADKRNQYMTDHVVDGRFIVPGITFVVTLCLLKIEEKIVLFVLTLGSSRK